MGAICSKGVSDLVFIEGSMDSKLYIDVLKNGLLPMYSRLGIKQDEYTFMEDGDPKHQSQETKVWKKNKGIKFIENWPPNSPDLNPIENLWAVLKRRVAQRKPSDLEEIKKYLVEEWKLWNRFEDDNFIERYINSMPKRISLVIRSKGFPIKY